MLIFDLDGTLVKHNGYKLDGMDTLLEGVKEYLEKVLTGVHMDCVPVKHPFLVV